jgi:RHS repeat-associated protein
VSGNNGNVRSHTIGPNPNLTQVYGYNQLNQLTSASETNPGATSTFWTRSYGYTNGNMYVTNNGPQVNGSPAIPLTNDTPTGTATGGTSWFNANNTINSWGTDANGNVTGIGTPSRLFTYDAENSQTSFTSNPGTGSASTSTYVYDGTGQRVQKTTGGVTTTYVYDAFGNLAAEYSSAGVPSVCGTPTCYFTVDNLGSTRMVTDATGVSAVSRYDYLPYGAELLVGIGGRTQAQGYQTSADFVNPKYTGQMRDPETGLDYFHARYYSSAQGRFQSADPANAGADLSDPQTWNGFGYVANNPVSDTDPSGLGFWSSFGGFLGNLGLNILTAGLDNFFGGDLFGASGGPLGGLVGSAAGSVNSGQPWNEQWSASSGSLNTGSVFGSGSAGGLVFSFEQSFGADVRLEAVTLPPGGAALGLGQAVGAVKATARSILTTLGGSYPGPELTNLIWSLRARSQQELAGENALDVYGVLSLATAIPRSSWQKKKFLKGLANDPKSPSWMKQWLRDGRVPPGYNVDHIVPLSLRAPDRPSNMRLVLEDDHVTHHIFYHPWRP